MQSKWKRFRKLDLSKLQVKIKDYNMIGNEGVHYLSEADWPNLV